MSLLPHEASILSQLREKPTRASHIIDWDHPGTYSRLKDMKFIMETDYIQRWRTSGLMIIAFLTHEGRMALIKHESK